MPYPEENQPSADKSTVEFQQLQDTLNFFDGQQIPVKWLNHLAAIDEMGSLDLGLSSSVQIAIDLADSCRTGKLCKTEVEQLYLKALQTQKAVTPGTAPNGSPAG